MRRYEIRLPLVPSDKIRFRQSRTALRFVVLAMARHSVPQIGAQTYQNPNVVEACTTENRLETLENLSERLDATQKSLSNYLDTKRNSFPRFFFISDDELLSVLGSSDPTSIQVMSF